MGVSASCWVSSPRIPLGSSAALNCSAAVMQIAIDLPEDVAEILKAAWRDLPRGVLEAVAVEGYRGGALSRDEVGRILGLSFWDADAFLKERRAYLAYNAEDLEQDRRDLDRIAPQ